MKTQNLTQIWICTPKGINEYGEITNIYTNLRSVWGNVQRDYSEIDAAEYGQTINEVIKIRLQKVPPIAEMDHLYFTKPKTKGKIEIEGEAFEDYGQGDYTVESVIPSKIGVQAVRNPTTVTARIIAKG